MRSFTVDEIRIHPNYDATTYAYDACLLKLSASTSGDFTPVCLVEDDVDYDSFKECWLTGYGSTSPNRGYYGNRPEQIHEILLSFVSNSECSSRYAQTTTRITEQHVCVGGERSKGYCFGDRGSPLSCKTDDSGPWFLAGIFSFGFGCGSGYPDILTKTSSVYSGFLENVINGEDPESRTLDCYDMEEFACQSTQCISSEFRCSSTIPYCTDGADTKFCGDSVELFNPIYGSSFDDVPRDIYSPITLDKCAETCLTSEGFICHHFDYNHDTSTCRLRAENFLDVTLSATTRTDFLSLKNCGGCNQVIEGCRDGMGLGLFSSPRYFLSNTRRKRCSFTLKTPAGSNMEIEFKHMFDDTDQPQCKFNCKSQLSIRHPGSTSNLLEFCLNGTNILPTTFVVPANEVEVEWFTQRPQMSGFIGTFKAI
uniref:Uncharacterized protein LOC100372165 n=1 Tax=Saccoglossus kowalevskii TaxID=10224 RepID=A0ABM0GPS4_SACKO|nr:PREDICTED: uncharacterized protein LOC100372165 [Saccoglossus kowalevskii]